MNKNTQPPAPLAISATGLRKSFGEKVVLDGIDIQAAEGTIFSLLGPNGAGKTTTVQILSTLIPASGGEARIAGYDVRTQADQVRAQIGVTGQFAAVDDLLTGTENLLLMADLNHIDRDEGWRRAAEMLEVFGLAAGDSLFLPPKIAELLDQLRAIGVSPRTVQIVYLAYDRAADWDPADPRLEQIADQILAFAARYEPGEAASAPELGNDQLTIALMSPPGDLLPAWSRLDGLIQERQASGKWLAAASAGTLGCHLVDDPDGYFGEPVAARYDNPADEMFQPEAIDPAVRLLAELAGSGRALELAIGTGRIGLPLSARGVPVHGIELSQAMAARLRAKPGGDAIPVTIGDMSTTRADGTFTLCYLVFNTINNLTTQQAQIACFHNAAGHLVPGGCFLIETNVPPLRQLPPGQDILGTRAGPGQIVSYSFDHATQQYHGHYAEFTDGTAQYRTIPFRYVWPSELDLMAQLAGLRPRDRWAGWNREPFTTDSRSHVSVWQKPAT
jgi:ABC transporter/Methyltransferase domain